MPSLLDRFTSTTPKKILSLDGGGIRGALTLGYLKKIEDILKIKYAHNSGFRLCDYFDLIGGTSTGAIIAGLLATGKTVDEITEIYMDIGSKIFGEKRNWWNPMETMKWLKANYNYKAMEDGLKLVFGDITLGSDELKTGLCIVAKRADTNSVWPLINHPLGTFYNSDSGKNKDILLWQVVRASTAAPTYFAPQMIEIMKDHKAAFVDGGLSMSNNPSLTLLMIATLKGFPFRWAMGEDKILLVSVGTGYTVFKKYAKEIDNSTLLSWAANIPNMLMQDASWQNQALLQWISNSPTATSLDLEMGNLDGDLLSGKALISYLRYNFCISENKLNELDFDRKFTEGDAKQISDMSNAANRQLLYQIGCKDAATVLPEHFDKFL